MDNNINDIDKFFKDRLDGHESPNVPGAWDKMEAMLDADNSGVVAKNIQKYVLSSIVGAIVLAGSVVGYISGYDNNISSSTQHKTISDKQTATIAPSTLDKSKMIINNGSEEIGESENALENSVSANSKTISNNTKVNSKNIDNLDKVSPKSPLKLDAVKSKKSNIKLLSSTPKEEITSVVNYSNTKLFTKKSFFNQLLVAKNFKINTDFEGFPDINDAIANQRLLIDSAQRQKRKLDNIERFYRLQFGIQAGGNFNRVLNNTSNNFEVGSGIMAGIFLSKNLSRKWAVNAEFNYLRSTGNNISRTISQTDFFLEKTTTNYFLVTKTFDYIQVPISVSYSPSLKHKFSLGASSMFMVNAKTDVATNRERVSEKSSSTVTENKVYEDLNTFNYGLLVGYEFNLPGRYSLGARYNQMFNDVTVNNFFNDNTKHLPANVQLFVKLNLTR